VGEQEPTVGYALVRSFLLTPFWSGSCASARCRWASTAWSAPTPPATPTPACEGSAY